MFTGATVFNQPLDNWDVSKVINMEGVFHSAEAFNQNLGNWDVSKVKEMRNMFQSCPIQYANKHPSRYCTIA
jgi:surface protein